MSKSAKQQSSPFSTGGGGFNFETRVQAAFVVYMLLGQPAPCSPNFLISKLKLQGKHAGFNTDDLIVFSKHPQTGQEAKLLVQIKHDIHITARDKTFAEVIRNARNDFDSNFNSGLDAIALITGPLSKTDVNDVRTILEWSRYSEDEKEFLTKINTAHFSSDAKRKKLEAFRTHLKTTSGDVSDKQLWEFLKVFYLIGYDLDTESGSMLSSIHSLISQCSDESALFVWSRILDTVQMANQNAGIITSDSLPEDIRIAFSVDFSSTFLPDVKRLKDHGNYILGKIKTTVGEVHIEQSELIDRLFDLVESSGFVIVSGARGSGKSGLVRTFSDLVSKHAPLFCIRAEELDTPHIDHVFSAIGLRGSLSNLEAGFASMPKKYLIIESLEKLLELKNQKAFTDLLYFLNRSQGWIVIATCRNYAYQPICFNFLQLCEVKFESLMLNGFTDNQITDLCKKIPSLKKLTDNLTLKSLLKTPFFAKLAFRVLEAGGEFTPEDGEKEFRDAVWRHVIANEQTRTDRLPSRRRQTFIDIAVKRAKKMVYGLSADGFDSKAVSKLEEDNLIHRDPKTDLIMLAHDVLEDWALEEYIENAYRTHLHNLSNFLDEIGHEPAINRAFRLWLHQKLRYGENVNGIVHFVFDNQDIEKHWRDATMIAVLQGDNSAEFLESLKDKLFLNDGMLLKRFFFILRIACRIPNEKAIRREEGGNEVIVDTLSLKPYGTAWQAIICFLLKYKKSLSKTLTAHIIALLHDWTFPLFLDEPLPSPSREVGLLALHLLDDLKESYGVAEGRKQLLSVIVKTASAIQSEFFELLETDVFVDSANGKRGRLNYVDGFCEVIFSYVESAFLSKYNADILIRLAHFEWFIQEHEREDDEEEAGNRILHKREISSDECFGIHRHKCTFFSPSGASPPFQYLLRYHPKKGLDFILDVLNKTAENYAHSSIDTPKESNDLKIGYPNPLVEQVEIHLNDGTSVKQYCSGQLWPAYCGDSVVPDLLKSALMALENWLIIRVEKVGSDEMERLFDYILRNSNSVMPTAVLASVATGFPEKIGKAALPLLRTLKLYRLDLIRAVSDGVGLAINWFAVNFKRDIFARLYDQERKTAALRSWRKDHLETLIIKLQFSEWKNEAISAIDLLRSSGSDNENIRFLFHRIDSRGWESVVDKGNNSIIFKPKDLEPDLKEVQQQSQERTQIINRFSGLFLWARKNFERQPFEENYYAAWSEALAEAKALFEELKTDMASDLPAMHRGAIVVAAAVFIRDYLTKLSEEDLSWCVGLITIAVTENADADNPLAIIDTTDHDGAAAAATTLPILLGYATDDKERLVIKRLIIAALTHVNNNICGSVADGIREHLWQIDSDFAQNCIVGAIEYARSVQNNRIRERQSYTLKKGTQEIARTELQNEKDQFREQFLRGEFANDAPQVTVLTHDPWHILTPCLMIPDNSTEDEHIALWSQMLTLFFVDEQNKNAYYSGRDDKMQIDGKILIKFIERFAKYLFSLHETGFEDYIDQLRRGCENAPHFMDYLITCVAMEAENKGQKGVYWQLWKELSEKVQGIAVDMIQHDPDHSRSDRDKRKLVRGMLRADINWQRIDFENQDIAHSKGLLLEFVANAGKNPDVFEALAKLMHYFRSVFFESGVKILAAHQQEAGSIDLFSGVNTAFYIERSIQLFLQLDQTGPLSKSMHEACLILLDAIVETASPRAYYLQEHLIHSRRIL